MKEYNLGKITIQKVYDLLNQRKYDLSEEIDLFLDLGKYILPKFAVLFDITKIAKKGTEIYSSSKRKDYESLSEGEKRAEAASNALIYVAIFEVWDTYGIESRVPLSDDDANFVINNARNEFVQCIGNETHSFSELSLGSEAFEKKLKEFYGYVGKHLYDHYNMHEKGENVQFERILGSFDKYAYDSYITLLSSLHKSLNSFRDYLDFHLNLKQNKDIERIGQWQDAAVDNIQLQKTQKAFDALHKVYIGRTYQTVFGQEPQPSSGELYIEPCYKTLIYSKDMDISNATWNRQGFHTLREEILSEENKPVILLGESGTGKTLFSYMCERKQIIEKFRMLVVDFSADFSGTIEEKINSRLRKENKPYEWSDILNDPISYIVLLVFKGLDDIANQDASDYIAKIHELYKEANEKRRVHVFILGNSESLKESQEENPRYPENSIFIKNIDAYYCNTLTYTNGIRSDCWKKQDYDTIVAKLMSEDGAPCFMVVDQESMTKFASSVRNAGSDYDSTKRIIIDLSMASGNTIIDQIDNQLHLDAIDCTWSDISNSGFQNSVMLVFDGLEELTRHPGTRHYNYINELYNFQKNNASNIKILVTARKSIIETGNLFEIPDGCKLIELCEFNESASRGLIDMWSKLTNGRSVSYEELNGKMGQLLKNPLMLTMLLSYMTVGNDEVKKMSQTQLFNHIVNEYIQMDFKKNSKYVDALPGEKEELERQELKWAECVALVPLIMSNNGIMENDVDMLLKIDNWLMIGYNPAMYASFLGGNNGEQFKEFLAAKYYIDQLCEYIDCGQEPEKWIGNNRLWCVALFSSPLFKYPDILTMASKYAEDQIQPDPNNPNRHIDRLNKLWKYELHQMLFGRAFDKLNNELEKMNFGFNQGAVVQLANYSINLFCLMTLVSRRKFDENTVIRQFNYLDDEVDKENMRKLMHLWKYAFDSNDLYLFAKQFIDRRADEDDWFRRCVRFRPLGKKEFNEIKTFGLKFRKQLSISQAVHDTEEFDVLRYYRGEYSFENYQKCISDERFYNFWLEDNPTRKYQLINVFNALEMIDNEDARSKGIEFLEKLKGQCDKKMNGILEAIIAAVK